MAVMNFQLNNNLTVDGIVGPKTWAALQPNQTTPGIYLKGVDVSHYEVDYDFVQSVKDGTVFMMTKATEGLHPDNTCAGLIAKARAAGIKYTGAYHFFHAGIPVQDQVAAFQDATKLLKTEMPAILDLEETSVDGLDYATVKERALQWLESVGGGMPILYVDNNMASLLQLDARFKNYLLWLADYSKNPPVPKPWDKWTFWQHTDTPVDTNWFNGSLDDLSKLFS
jgi:GH25 family lysozyme M1 (1,4-beta-N-acetylmuramidase)